MKTVNITIRPMTDDDLPAVLEIENLCFFAPWKEQAFKYEIHENPVSNSWVIELEESGTNLKNVFGYCIYWHTFDSATLCKIAVHPALHRCQLGSAMMDEILNDCYAKKVRNITLEVRKYNAKAHSFYLKHGFKDVVIKPQYYEDGEDAIYMMRAIDF